MNKHGLFIRGGHPTDEMREKIRRGVKRHWDNDRRRTAKSRAADERSEEVKRWIAAELAKVREQLR